MNPLLIPPRLLFRALDDLHTLATAAARLDEVERRVNERIGALLDLGERIEASFDERTEAILAMGDAMDKRAEAIDARAEAIIGLGERVDQRAEAILAMGDRLDERAEAIIAQGERMDGRADAILDQGERVIVAAREVADRGQTLAEALPVMQRAIEMAQPLEGAVERLGRVIDRLPGPRRPGQS